MITYAARLFQSPSLLISGSGSWPPREGLLSPAALQIYRRNFPPVGYQGRIFLAATERKTLPTCLVLSARTTKVLFLYVLFHGVWKPFYEP